MFRKPLPRILVGATLLALLISSLAAPVLAFDGREGDNVTIPADEVVNDDLYIAAQTIVIDGTVKGDLVAFAQTITINGVVEGDLIAAGQTVIIHGEVQDDVRIAGAALVIGKKAKIGSDFVGAGASLEAAQNSNIGQDLVFAGGQALLGGDISRNVMVAAAGSLALQGSIGGDVKVDVGSGEKGYSNGSGAFMPNTDVTIPQIESGLSIAPDAKIGGDLQYTSREQINIPDGVVAGKIAYTKSAADKMTSKPVTIVESLFNGGLDIIRTIITLILFGLLLLWIFPGAMKTTTEHIKAAPLPSLGWGFIYIAAFFFALLVLFIAMLVGGITFGILTLRDLSGAVIFLGLLSLFALVISFMLAIWFVAQIIVSTAAGQLLLARFKPELAEHPYWPLVIGVCIYALLVTIPILGFLVWCVVALLGLGALWHVGQETLTRKPGV